MLINALVYCKSRHCNLPECQETSVLLDAYNLRTIYLCTLPIGHSDHQLQMF